MSKDKCPTILLSDDPTTDDRFGSHQRVAEALVELMQSEAGGRSIALVGPWGAGKSSVVSIASKIAAGKVDFLVFDAWAHQGDSLRRVFIEKAIQHFEQRGWIKNPCKWAKEKEKLSGRLEERRSTRQRKLTPAGSVIAVASLLLVITFQLFSIEKLAASNLAYRLDVYVLITMVTSALLILWTLIASGARGDTWGMLLDKEGGTTVSETARNVEPTSVEFQEYFGALFDECLADRQEPFVISIDNLDRVAQSDALSVWATLRTFLELQSFRNYGWSQRVWILVPFAPEILKTWAKLSDGSAETAVSIGKAFLAKNFQVVFHVPRPVLSDWQDFVLQQLQAALPRHDHSELQDVVRIAQLPQFNLNLDNLATPREIKLFVNLLGAVHRQWGDQVPLQMQALYLMLEDTAEGIEAQLRRPADVLGNVPPGLIRADWREWVAALHYNIPKDRALHVLLSDKILNALQSGSSGYFESQSSLPGFLRVLYDVISYRAIGWSQNESVTLALAAKSINMLDRAEPLVLRCRDELCDALERVANWPTLNAEIGSGLLAMMEWRESKEFAATVISLLAKASPQWVPGSDTDRERYFQVWADALFSVVNRIKAAHSDLLSTLKMSSGGDVRTYLGVARSLVFSGHSKQIPQLLNPTDPAHVLNQLAGIAAQAGFRETEAEILDVLVRVYPTLEFSSIAGSLSTVLRANNNPPLDVRLATLLALLRMSATVKPAQDAIRPIVQEGHIASSLSKFLEAKDDSGQKGVAASFIAMLIYQHPANPLFRSQGNQPGARFFYAKLEQASDRDLISRICKLGAALGLSGQLSQIVPAPGNPDYSNFYLMVRQGLSFLGSSGIVDPPLVSQNQDPQ